MNQELLGQRCYQCLILIKHTKIRGKGMETLLQKYARLAIYSGVNLQKGQVLILNTTVEAVELTREVVKVAYEAGAKDVQVTYQDEMLTRYMYQYQSEETLTNIPDWFVEKRTQPLRDGACLLHIISEYPGNLKDCDPAKIAARQRASSLACKEASEYVQASKTQWSLLAYPNKEWAMAVFPECEDAKAAQELLLEQILACSRVDETSDPLVAWEELSIHFRKRVDALNAYAFKTLHFKNALGTDVMIGLPENHIWGGGSEISQTGIEFNANIPTEEIFTMPHKYQVQGKVVASKPLLYNGVLIEDFWFRFQDGKVVDYDAKIGKETLTQLIEFDKGSCYIGEVALVPYDSPISNSNILFLNTLFDENAACHLALGEAYTTCIKDGIHMSEAELEAHGVNVSYTHVDFMFGTADMEIVGIGQDDSKTPIFHKGNFTF